MSNKNHNTQTTNQHPQHTSGTAKVQKVMHEFKHGELHSSSGELVENPKQAIAIALSEQRQADKKRR